MPLVSGGGSAGAGQAEQQELPAWLESLRAHERPVPGGQENRRPFSLDELVDEDSMPSWMRQDRQKLPEAGNSDSFPVMPAMQTGSSTEKQSAPSMGFQAGSLIDERSLPAWMRENQGGGQAAVSPQNMPASSLVDQQSLPPWLKESGQVAQQQTPPTGNRYNLSAPTPTAPVANQYGLPIQTPITPPAGSTRIPQTPPASDPPQQGFSAHDLLDMQAMPGWMSGTPGPGTPPTRPVPTGQGFAAGELIDQRSVPTWMKDLQGQDKSDPRSAMGVPVNGSGQTWGQGQGTASGEGMPAGSLLDMNSMPAWMREDQQGNSQATQPGPQGMAAGSLIDMGALPAWLRNADNTPSNAHTSGRLGQPPARPVPSRPRNEMASQEQSEAAANVFSSMLGVAASTPALPGQEQMPGTHLGVAQGQPMSPMPPSQQAQPNLPPWQQQPAPGMGQYNQGAQPPMWQMSGPMPMVGQNPYATPTGQAGNMGNMPPRANAINNMEQPAWNGISPMDRAPSGANAGAGGNNASEPPTASTKKKGFFDSIRDFFFH
jgi:hypothetical protein